MKKPHILIASLIGLSFATAAHAQSGGSLTPPLGAPTTTMKSLDEVEARTAISTLPYTISTSGSYYLTKSLSSATDGITITASNVSLDLNGFSLTGTSVDLNHEGVKIEGSAATPIANVEIRNGAIQGFGNSAEFLYANNSILSHIRSSNAAVNSIVLSNANGNQIEGNIIRSSTAGGILATTCNSNIIQFNRITRATATNTLIGISCNSGSFNQIINNSCVGFNDNFLISATNISGPELSSLGVLGNNTNANHSWVNFSLNEAP